MSKAEIMQFLADNYTYGIAITIIFVIAIYILISVRILLSARRQGIDVCASAMIPIYHLSLPIRVAVRKSAKRKILQEDEEITL